jgi:hypothetical protein
MAESPEPQSYRTHRKYVPGFHFVAVGILTINLLWSLYRLFTGTTPVFDRVLDVLLAFALILVAFYARVFAMGVQDRVIRLEERLRLTELLPADLKPRIGELRRSQLVALRFASDAELPGLVRKVLDEKIADPNEIKKLIRDWRADHFRA